jgi:hypothetical protein
VNDKSRAWFSQRSYQQTYSRVAEIPAIVLHGPNQTEPQDRKMEDKEGRKLFIVGKTKVGGEEVV